MCADLELFMKLIKNVWRKTEEELEIVNESEGEHEREYVIVEDAEKYQILPVEHQYQIHSNVVYFQGSYSAL